MGTLNELPPIVETHHITVPALPGWYMIDRLSEDPDEVTKTPIVAWIVETEFYKRKRLNNKTQATEETNEQGRYSESHPVWIGGYDHTRSFALGPDGCVYELEGSQRWPDIPSWITWDVARFGAQVKAGK